MKASPFPKQLMAASLHFQFLLHLPLLSHPLFHKWRCSWNYFRPPLSSKETMLEERMEHNCSAISPLHLE